MSRHALSWHLFSIKQKEPNRIVKTIISLVQDKNSLNPRFPTKWMLHFNYICRSNLCTPLHGSAIGTILNRTLGWRRRRSWSCIFRKDNPTIQKLDDRSKIHQSNRILVKKDNVKLTACISLHEIERTDKNKKGESCFGCATETQNLWCIARDLNAYCRCQLDS